MCRGFREDCRGKGNSVQMRKRKMHSGQMDKYGNRTPAISSAQEEEGCIIQSLKLSNDPWTPLGLF